MTSIAFADDHLIVLEPLASIINQFPGFQVTIKATDGQQLIDAINEQGPPDIVLLDVAMPVMDGCETLLWLRKHHPAVKVLILTMYGSSPNLVFRMLAVGARGVLKKDIVPEDLEEAFCRVRDDDDYYIGMDKGEVDLLLKLVNEKKVNVGELLSNRELLSVQMLCKGESPKAIADYWGVALRTVQLMFADMVQKLGLKSQEGLAIYAERSGLKFLRPGTEGSGGS